MRFLKMMLGVVGLALVTACAEQTPLSEQGIQDLGEFRLNVNYAYAEKASTVPPTRKATPAEWQTTMERAVAQRLGRYDGSQPYDLGISVEGYLLAPKGVPVLYNPRSTLIVKVNLYDPVEEKWIIRGHQMQSLENTESDTVFWGSGRTRTKQQQMDGLAYNILRQLEKYMLEGHAENGWFNARPASGGAEPSQS